jgi:hypothetical protein
MQRTTQKAVTSLNKGLITEAGELTFPENASIDELNCLLERDGSRRKRPALQLEEDYAFSSFSFATGSATVVDTWWNAGGLSGNNLLVVQLGTTLRFYTKSALPYYSGLMSFSVDLSAFENSPCEKVKCSFASINGALIVASEALNTFIVTLDTVTNTITSEKITFRVRDFKWLSDTKNFGNSVPASEITQERIYDTSNGGWAGVYGDAALESYKNAQACVQEKYPYACDPQGQEHYPPLTHPWYSGKDADGDFNTGEWIKVYGGTSLLSNGHWVLDFFYKDRSGVSGQGTLPVEVEPTRFKSVASYAGRIFYGGLGTGKNSGTLLFSRLLYGSFNDIGECFQVNDPTVENTSDLLETDGGTVVIPEASNIQYLHPFGETLLVFAENGVWAISGLQGSFDPTGYSIDKVTNVGLINPKAFVSVEGLPFWWSSYGIHTMAVDKVSQKLQEQNISLSTIQSFYQDIPNKLDAVGSYDEANKRIYWQYSDTVNKRSKYLVLDIALQAFYPWAIDTNTIAPMSLVYYSPFSVSTFEDNVLSDSLGPVTTTSGTEVIVNAPTGTLTTEPKMVAVVWDLTTRKIAFAVFKPGQFKDFGTGVYPSYVEAGYDFAGDLLLKKSSPYITVYLRETQTGWDGSESEGYDPVGESSLFLSAYWDFKNTPSSTQQTYLPKPYVTPPALTGASVTVSRLKVRGSGRSVRLKFVGEDDKDFVLLGYSVVYGANARY